MIFIESIDFTTSSLVYAFSKIVFTAQGLIAALYLQISKAVLSKSICDSHLSITIIQNLIVSNYNKSFYPRFLSISDIVVHLVSIINEYHRLAIFSVEQAGRIVRNI